MAATRIRAVVSGRVQGVGFRYYCRSAAMRAGLSGWVRNCGDGTVELEAQGEQEQVEAFLKQVSQGPPLSRVTNVNRREMPVDSKSRGFAITY